MDANGDRRGPFCDAPLNITGHLLSVDTPKHLNRQMVCAIRIGIAEISRDMRERPQTLLDVMATVCVVACICCHGALLSALLRPVSKDCYLMGIALWKPGTTKLTPSVPLTVEAPFFIGVRCDRSSKWPSIASQC